MLFPSAKSLVSPDFAANNSFRSKSFSLDKTPEADSEVGRALGYSGTKYTLDLAGSLSHYIPALLFRLTRFQPSHSVIEVWCFK